MGIEDRDFIMRQVRQIAEGLGALLSRQTLKALLPVEQSASTKLSDADLDALILSVEVKKAAATRKMTTAQLVATLGLTPSAWEDLSNNLRLPTEAELLAMRHFLQPTNAIEKA